jgi:hypothetical protein
MDKGMDSVKKAAMLLLLSPILVPTYLIISLVGLVFPVQFTRWFIFNVPGASWQQGDITTEQWQAAHAAAPEVNMPDIGEAVVHDYRPTAQTRLGAVGSVRVCSWNIFLGQNLQVVVDELLAMDPMPDVILLQEDNIFKDSRGESPVFRHAGAAVARALQMKCVFVSAYYRGRVDDDSVRGCYGMSILSPHELLNITAFKCEVCSVPWLTHKIATPVVVNAHSFGCTGSPADR